MISKEEIDKCPDTIEKRRLINEGIISLVNDIEKIIKIQPNQPFFYFNSNKEVEKLKDEGIEVYVYNKSGKLMTLYSDEVLVKRDNEINKAYA